MKLYNTLSRQKETLKPLSSNTVKLYTCGLTVYAQPHIGNWVSYVYWDVLQRALQAEGYDVQRVQNITDVGHLVSDDDSGEDKMEKGARAEGSTAWDVAQKYIDIADREAYEQLGLLRPTIVRATDCIDQQIAFVQELETKGYTYIIEGEGVYFDTSKLDDYGKLARLDIEGLDEGARVVVDGKRSKTDFALWKFSPADQQRDMEWDSPWGKGFPGWHLECSVIARENLGDQIDIHTGGIDHIPVHHTNEIAQTETLTGKAFAAIWLHNNHIKVDGGKMAKSKGNVYTLSDITDKGFFADAYKLMLLSKHYRTEGNFTWDIVEAAQNRLNNWRAVAERVWQLPESDDSIAETIQAALNDDLDTPKALSVIDEYFDVVQQQNKAPHKQVIEAIHTLLGIDLSSNDIDNKQKALLDERATARAAKDWQASDTIRDQLAQQGIAINDTGTTQTWHRTR